MQNYALPDNLTLVIKKTNKIFEILAMSDAREKVKPTTETSPRGDDIHPLTVRNTE